MDNKNIDFVARHYRKGLFSSDAAWRRLGITPVAWWKRYRVAAAVALGVIISATGAIVYHDYQLSVGDSAGQTVAVSPLAEVKAIDFENAPLTEVVTKIETVYNVKIGNLPPKPENYELSLHYEGTPTDLIAVINEILGTQMTVAEK